MLSNNVQQSFEYEIKEVILRKNNGKPVHGYLVKLKLSIITCS